jgi:proteasome lid subunit RPN8/RPN11
MLILSKTRLSEINTHAESDYPHECCGALIGTIEGDQKKVMHIEPIVNNWEDEGDETKTRRFMISSDDYRAMEKKASELKLNLLGFYHSHPDHPPEPSDTDLKFAWPFFSYPIVSVKAGKATELKSFYLHLDSQSLVSEDVVVTSN